MGTNKEIEIRREKVAILTLQGFSASQIAKVLKVTPRTIEKDRENHRKNWTKKFKKEPFEKVLYSFSMQNDAVCKKAWKILENSSDEKIKIKCLNTIDRCAERNVKILQSLGVVDQAPDKLELSGKLTVQKIIEIGRQIKKEKEESHEKASV